MLVELAKKSLSSNFNTSMVSVRPIESNLWVEIENYTRQGFHVLPSAPHLPSSPGEKDAKSPRRIGSDGKPYRLTPEQRANPDSDWLKHPDIGVGVVPTGNQAIIDIDLKNAAQCGGVDAIFAKLCELIPGLENAPRERTPSGGLHIFVRLSQPLKQHVNWRLNTDGPILGEIRGAGSFTVVAPTTGYETLQTGEMPEVSLENILWGDRETPTPGPKKETPKPVGAGRSVKIEDLISKNNRVIFEGQATENEVDRSELLTPLARDLVGWHSFCLAHGFAPSPVEDALLLACERLGIDAAKGDRVLDSIAESSEPAMLRSNGGNAEACIRHVEKVISMGIGGRWQKPKDNKIWVDGTHTPGIIALENLFSDRQNYVTIGGVIHKFNGEYYEKQEDGELQNRIAKMLERCYSQAIDKDGNATIKRSWPTSRHAKDALEYSRMSFRFVPLNDINPVGAINCKNGVLWIRWREDDKTKFELELTPHSASVIFTYKPLVAYDPAANPKHCNRLLDAIQDEHRPAVLRVLASALDLPHVRRLKGRSIRTLFFTGDGANGKDSLREAFTAIFGSTGISSCTIQDFAQYDQGRKFGLANLATARINWASENDVSSRIDNLQSLKQAATGDTLQTEIKNIQGQDYTPRALLIFNTNDPPNLIGKSRASSSRYSVVPFTKTYVEGANRKNEIEADSRFKYDSDWVYENVCPALLNRLLMELQLLLSDGIDYGCFDETMEQNRLESSHLYRWLMEGDLIADANARIESDFVWDALDKHYRAEGCLFGDKENPKWGEDPRPGDRLVKSKMQLVKRLKPYVPSIESRVSNSKRYIYGLRFKTVEEKAAEQEIQTEKMKEMTETQTVNNEPEIPTKSPVQATEQEFPVNVIKSVAQVFVTVKNSEDWNIATHGKSKELINQAWAILTLEDQNRITEAVKDSKVDKNVDIVPSDGQEIG